jgi:hypothetical protein
MKGLGHDRFYIVHQKHNFVDWKEFEPNYHHWLGMLIIDSIIEER